MTSGEKVKCTLPKITINDPEIQIEYILQKELKDSIIYFPQCAVLDGYNEIVRINKIRSEEPVNITNGKEIQYKHYLDISIFFVQILGFQAEEKIISFIFIGYSTEILKEDETVEMNVNLIKRKELVEEKAICYKIESSQNKDIEQVKTQFECKIENIENGKEYIGLELISSENIAGIPNNKDLLNPAEVDILIYEGKIKNYTSKEFKNDIIPEFNVTSINTTNSEKTGIFIINCETLSNFSLNKSIEFEIKLVSGQKAICVLPKLNSNDKNIHIKCVLQEELRDSKIMIQKCLVFDGYNALFVMNKISSEESVIIANGQLYQNEIKYDINVSFGQMNSFTIKEKIISYFFIGFSTQSLIKNYKIKMVVNLINGEELVEEEAICTSLEDVYTKYGMQIPITFECKIENIQNANEYSGLEIVESDKISGIPNDIELLNPAIVDLLIEEGEIEDYSSEEYKNKEIPVFNISSIDTTDSIKTGVFILIGEFLPEIKLEIRLEFELILLSGEKALCSLPKIDGKGEIKIECLLQEELKENKIMIGQCSIFEEYKELIRIKKISTAREVTVANGKNEIFKRIFNNHLSFRQTNNFKFDSSKKTVSFIINIFTIESIKKGDEITVNVNLLLTYEEIKKEAKCKVNKDIIIQESVIILSVDLNCEINNIALEKDVECLGLEIEESKNITSIPKDKSCVILEKLIN